jgi:hypothetical protein
MRPIGAFLGLVLLVGLSDEAMAQCSGTQIMNTTGVTETATVTFNGSTTGGAGSIVIAGVTGSYSGNRDGTDQATAFDSTSAGAAPPDGGGYTFTGTYSGWNAGAASGAVVVYTSTTPNADVPDLTASVSGVAVAPTIVTTPGSPTGAQNLTTLLTGSLVCGRPGASYPGGAGSSDRWQEQHRTGGALFDFKRGVGHPIDPEKLMGTYAFTGSGTTSEVTHTYGALTYNWRVFQNGTVYSFCTAGGAEHVRAYITAGGGVSGAGCSVFPP